MCVSNWASMIKMKIPSHFISLQATCTSRWSQLSDYTHCTGVAQLVNIYVYMLYCTVEGDIYFNDSIEYHMALHQQYVELTVNNVNNVYTTTSGTVQDYTGMPVDGCMKEGDTAVLYSEGTGDHIIYIYIYIYIYN